MPIVQVPLEVPEDVYKKILNGSYELLGMVKDSNNRIRKHVPRARLGKSNKVKQVEKEGVLQLVKKNKVVVIGLGVVVAVAGAGTYAYNNWKEHKIKTAEERVEYFKKSLKEYLKVAKKGKLNINVINNLLNSLNELDKKKIGRDIELTISVSQFTELISSIFSYTESLAEANDYAVKVNKPKSGVKENMVCLKAYLEIQKDILEKSA